MRLAQSRFNSFANKEAARIYNGKKPEAGNIMI